jgi:hypothetical protein
MTDADVARLDLTQRLRGTHDPMSCQAADEIDRLANALRTIAGELPPSDYMLADADIARIVLHGR